jgi:pimeloyl-ACP methyl ester carboxylesterase
MFGVVTRPAVIPPRASAIVVLEKGALGDVWRWLAESLARRGLVVVRFEPVGIGDSPGTLSRRDVPMSEFFRTVQEGAYARDTEDVVLWTQRAYGVNRIHVLGICATCASALLAGAALPAVVSGLILVTPAVLYVSLHPQRDAGTARALRAVRWLLRQPISRGRRTLGRICRTGRPSHPAFNWRFWTGFRAVMKHGTPVLTLLAEMDEVTRDFVVEFQRPVIDQDARYRRLCRIRLLPRADHSLLFEGARLAAFEAIGGWLDSLEGWNRADARQPEVRASTQRMIPAGSAAVSTSA